jgi:chromosome segregation ATPase
MKKQKTTIRNERFAIAFDYLRRYQGVKRQNQLAALMQVSEDSITRVKKGGKVTEDFITKFQTAAKSIFNLQWLRGESDIMLAIDAQGAENPQQSASTSMPDYSSLMNATIAAQESTIASLKRELADKEESTKRELAMAESAAKREIAAKQETIDALRSQLNDRDAHIETLRQQVSDLRATIARLQTKDVLGNYPSPMGVAEDFRSRRPAK